MKNQNGLFVHNRLKDALIMKTKLIITFHKNLIMEVYAIVHYVKIPKTQIQKLSFKMLFFK